MHASPVKHMVFTAVCCALCVVLPVAFHSIQNAGSVFLPIHIPVLLCGLVCGWPYGLTCGFLGPLLSSLVTQMPPLGMAPAMMIECGLAVELGILLDVFVLVFIMGIAVMRINSAFEHIDSDKLNLLEEQTHGAAK